MAVAYVSLAVSGQGLRKDVDKALGQATAGADKQGRGMGSKLAKGFGLAATAGFAGAGALAGTALVKGFGRLKSLDDARGKLEGLGHSAKATDGIMKNALASVKGTAFGMDEAATTAAGSVAAGIKPGKELEKNLKLVADAATIAGTDMGSMGSIFNKVAASNKIQGDVIAQLGDQGIPILQFLSKELGVTAEEASKMASEGKVDFKTFQTAMQNGLGGAAQKSGETFSGAFKNMGAAAGRLGASLLSGIFPQMKGGFGGITDLLDRMGPAAETWGKRIGGFISRVSKGAKGLFDLFVKGDFSKAFREAFGVEEDHPLVGFLFDLRDNAIGIFNEVKGAVTAFGNAWKYNDGEITSSGLPGFMERVGYWARQAFDYVRSDVIPNLVLFGKFLWDNRKALAAVAGAIAGVMIIKKVVAAFKAFSLILAANPIGLVVAAIVGLVYYLTHLYRTNETAREFMQAAWAKIKAAISAAIDWVINTGWPLLQQAFSAIGDAANFLWQNAIKPSFDLIWGIAKSVFGWIKNTGWPLLKTAFDAIAATVKWLWNVIIKPYFTFVLEYWKTVFGWIKNTGWPWLKTAFDAIAAAAKWLWTNAIKPSFEFIWGIAKKVFGWIKDTGWPWLKTAFQFIADKAKWLWDNAIKPSLGFIWDKAKSVFGWVKNTGWPLMRDAFQAIGDKVGWLWDKAKVAFDKIKAGVSAVKDAFAKARDGIGVVWDKLSGIISTPITSALSWIESNFLSKIRSVLRAIGADSLASKIPVLGGGSGQAKRRQSSGVQKYAAGGLIHGPWRGSRADNVLGISDAGVPVARVNPREFITSVKATASMERNHPGALSYINRFGRLPGFAMGGKVGGLNAKFLQALHRFNAAAGGRFSVISGLRTRAEQQVLYNRYLAGTGNLAARPGTSRHETGNAADLSPSSARDTHGALARKFGLHFPVPGEPWHVELVGGGSGGGGGFFSGLAGKILEQGRKALDAILDRAPGGFWMQAGVAGIRHVIQGIVDRVNSAASAGDGSAPSGAYKGGNVERWRGTVNKALGIMGLSDKYANSTLRRMNQESGGNPRAINNWDSNAAKGTPSKGLMQVIDPTFRAYAHPSYARDIYDPLSNILASMRYAQARYGSLWAAYDRKGGYASGGLVKPAVFDNGGTLAPGHNHVYNATGKPEPLVRADRPQRLHPEDVRAIADAVRQGASEGVSGVARRSRWQGALA